MSRENKLRKQKSRRERGLTRKAKADEPLSGIDAVNALAARRGLAVLSMNISFVAVKNPAGEGKAIFEIAETERERLHNLLYDDPGKAVEPLQRLVAQHPGDTTLTQWLTAALRAVHRDDEADKLAEENYRAHPKYLFARLDYANALLRGKRFDEIDAVLDHQYHLKSMYPDRDTFHISELSALSMFMVEFFIAKGMLKQAEVYADSLEQIDPDNPATAATRQMLTFARMKQGISRFLK